MSNKKRLCAITFLFAAFCACMVFSAFILKTDNVYAYTFDKESEYNWTLSGLSKDTDSSVYYEGNSSLKFTDNKVASSTSATLSENSRFEVTNGVIYEVSAYFCSVDCSADTFFEIDLVLYNGSSSTTLAGTQYALNAGTARSQWTKAVTRLEIPDDGAEYSAGYLIKISGGYATVWVDEFNCFIVEDENEVIVEYEDFSSFSSDQAADLKDYSKTQQIGEWQLEAEQTPSDSTSFIEHTTNEYVADSSSAKSPALRLCAYKDAGYAYATKKVTTLFKDNVYKLTGHYKTSDNAIYTYAGIKFYDYSGNEISGYEKSVQLEYGDISANEKEFSIIFTAPSNLYAKIYLGTTGYSGNNPAFNFYFRDIKISLLKYGNMLSDYMGMYFDTVSYEIQAEEAISGYALKAVLDSNGDVDKDDGYVNSMHSYVTLPGNGVRLQKDKNYIFSYYVKVTDVNGGSFGVKIHFNDESDTGIPDATKYRIGKTCDWTKVEMPVSVTKNQTIKKVVFRNFGDNGKTMTIYLDEIKLTLAEEYDVSPEWNKAINVNSVYGASGYATCDETYAFNMKFSLTDTVKTPFVPRANILDANGNRVTTVTLDCSVSAVNWSAEEENDCAFTFTVPYWLSSGNYSLQLDKNQANLSCSNNVMLSFSVGSSGVSETVAEVKDVNGVPTLVINDKAKSPSMYSYPSSNYGFLSDTDDELYTSGLELFVTFEGNLEGDSRGYFPIWKENGDIDYDEFDRQVERSLYYNGNGYAMINISIYAPDWWLEQNPDERAVSSTGAIAGENSKGEASFSSTKFRSDAGAVLRSLVTHMKSQSYYKRIFGFKLSSGRTAEWMNYSGGGYTNDMSAPALVQFKAWAENKYATVATLNAAWQTSYTSFDEVAFPTLAKTSDYGIMLDSETQRQVIDYYLFLNDMVADSFLYYAQTVKEATENKKIVGGYFGYSWFTASYGGIGTEHLSMERVLASDYVDYVASPVSYSLRLLGRSSQFMAAHDTVQAYGKLYLLEQDNRTSAIEQYTGAWDASADAGIGRTHTVEDSVYELKRDFANDFINGNAYWYYDMFGGWFDDSQIYAFMKDSKAEYDYSLTLEERSNNSEVALFVSNSIYSYGVDSSDSSFAFAVYDSMIRSQKNNLSAAGAPYDVYKTDTLVAGKVPSHKVNIILSAYEITEAERNAVNTYLKKDGQYVIWVYICGLSDGSTSSYGYINSLTGFTVSNANTAKSNVNLQATFTKNTGIAAGLNGKSYGNVATRAIVKPYVSDATSAEIFATYSGTSKCALAKRDMGEWTSIYSGSVNLPAALLRNIYKEAGVHVYSESDNDIIYANSNYVALHSGVSENKTIYLDGNYAVYDVFAKEYIYTDTNVIEYAHVAKDTKIFRLSKGVRFTVEKVINGETQTETVNSPAYVLPETYGGNGVLVGWLYNGKLYFGGETLNLTENSIQITAVIVDYTVKDGADLRLDTQNAGIRFYSEISAEDKAYLISISEEEVEFGTRIVSADMTGHLDVKTQKWVDKGDVLQIRTVLTGFSDEKPQYFNYRFCAKGYFTITVNGEKHTFYTASSENKIIAKMALNAYVDRKATQTDEYCNYVEETNLGTEYSGYSKFSNEQLGILWEFVKYANSSDYYINDGDLSKWLLRNT